jgi:flavodoxin
MLIKLAFKYKWMYNQLKAFTYCDDMKIGDFFMKALIVFYSLQGNCKMIAEEIGNHIQADVLQLFPVDDIKPNGFGRYLWGGRQVIKQIEPELKAYTIDLSAYDMVIIGTPVWANTYAPALRTFLSHNEISGKNVALYACSGGNKGKTFLRLKERLANNTIVGEIDFIDPIKKDRASIAIAVKEWVAGFIAKNE